MASKQEDNVVDCITDEEDEYLVDSPAGEEDTSKYFTGTHEVQECLKGQGEIDLGFYKEKCQKSHADFVPVNNFTVEHFPSDYRDKDLYDVTKALAELTVRIAVKFTSPDRPEFVPGTKDPYPCYNTRGQNSLHTGTGRVWHLIKFPEGEWPCRTCPCPECDHSDTPSKVWWRVSVKTARHVVFDESEARQSSCRLWFDEENCPVVNIYGWDVESGSYVEDDTCELYCVTHDRDLADKLEKMAELFYGQCDNVNDKYKSRKDVDKLAIIVSHPHGCSKQVSIGRWVDKQWVGGLTRYTYTTSTCPGSSGAMVCRIGGGWADHPHSGTHSGQLNYSGVDYPDDSDSE